MNPQHHSFLSFFVIALIVLFPFGAKANPAASTAAKAIIRTVLQTGNHEMMDRLSQEAAEKVVARSIRKLGEEETGKLLRRGGVNLLKAATKSGGEVLEMAHRLPDAAEFVIHNPDEALALARRFGDNAVRLEAKIPGCAALAEKQFGKSELGYLSRKKPDEVIRLLGYARQADNGTTRAALYKSWKKGGTSFLKELDKRKRLILTGGLTVSIVKVAGGVERGIEQIPQIIPDDAMGEATETLAKGTAAGINQFLILIPLTIGCIFLFRLWLYRPRK